MTTKIVTSNEISSSQTETLAAGNSLIVISGVYVGSTGSASAAIGGSGNGMSITVDGQLFGDACVNLHSSTGVSLVVGAGGLLLGGTAFVNVSLGASAFVANHGQMTGENEFGDGSYLSNDGAMNDTNDVVIFTGGSNTVFNSGTISATGNADAVSADGGGNEISNSGTISAGREAIDVSSGTGGNAISNTGTLSSSSATIGLVGGFNSIVNEGHITSTGYTAILLQSIDTDGQNVIHNTGTISGNTGSAIDCGAADFTLYNSGDIFGSIFSAGSGKVVNSGDITGNITFGSNTDTYNGSQGSIEGIVDGGLGNDLLKGGAADDQLRGGGGQDVLKGGGGDDILAGGAGADLIRGGDEQDTFVYTAVTDSKGAGYDTIIGFDSNDDTFQFGIHVNAIDGTINSGTLNSASFTADLQTAVTAASLGAHHAVLFTASSGDLSGHTFLIVDANGAAGYQSSADYVIELNQSLHLAALSAANFEFA